jgi:predicted nucleotidyltransferase component of viral defense system
LTTFDPSLFPDIANAIGLQSPAFVEKDYYAIQLLKIVSEIEIPEGKFIFAGGTCLAKAHLPTFRMSEDIDIKFLPNDDFLKQSDSQKRKNRSNLGTSILQSIEKSQLFSIINKESRSEGRYRCFSINYPKTYTHQSLRSELKLEFTEIGPQLGY